MKKNIEDFVTCGQMKILERRADENGLSYYQMMENAGTGAARLIMDHYAYGAAMQEDTAAGLAEVYGVAEEDVEIPNHSPNGDVKAYLFCGKGNNGGDGFVAARFMCEAGYDVTVILVDGTPKTEDSIANFRLLQNMPVSILDMNTDERLLLDLKDAPDIIVDAIYGTGFRGELTGNGLKAAIYINRHFEPEQGMPLQRPVLIAALDIPSGLRGDMTNEKELNPRSVTAHVTITFHARKPVHLQKFASKYCGTVKVVDIGIDETKLWHVDI